MNEIQPGFVEVEKLPLDVHCDEKHMRDSTNEENTNISYKSRNLQLLLLVK